MKLVFLSLLFIFSINSYAALDCHKECTSGSDGQCIHFGMPLKFTVKTLLDVMNLYTQPHVPNVKYTPCKRITSSSGLSFENKGKNLCKEYSVPADRNPGDSIDPNNQFYVQLPDLMKGHYISEIEKITFDDLASRPLFVAKSNAKIWTSGYIFSAFLLNQNNTTKGIELVLESEKICYSILVGYGI